MMLDLILRFPAIGFTINKTFLDWGILLQLSFIVIAPPSQSIRLW